MVVLSVLIADIILIWFDYLALIIELRKIHKNYVDVKFIVYGIYGCRITIICCSQNITSKWHNNTNVITKYYIWKILRI